MTEVRANCPAAEEPSDSASAVNDEWSFTPDYSERLTEFMASGWEPSAPAALEPAPPVEILRRRRDLVRAELGNDKPAIVTSGQQLLRNGDQYYMFRAHSDYVWLTGDQSAGGVLILDPSAAAADEIYLDAPLPRSDPRFYTDAHSSEVWVGARPSLAAQAEAIGIEARPLTELPKALAKLSEVEFAGGADPALRPLVAESAGSTGQLAMKIAKLRMIKDEWEIAEIRQAIDYTIGGFEAVRDLMRRHGDLSERAIETEFAAHCRRAGNGVGFNPIVGGGRHATTLHWTSNDGIVSAGEMVLLDLGAETKTLYCGDLTRTLPIDGSFSDSQRRVYECVLAAEEAALSQLRPGVAFRSYYPAVERTLVEGLAGLNVLPVSVEESLDPECGLHRRWTLCAPGHHLGLDVHDCHRACEQDYLDGVLRPGMVLTIEPGLYFQANDTLVPAPLRGTGVRIEDDVLITQDGYEVLSQRLPRRTDEVEAWCRS